MKHSQPTPEVPEVPVPEVAVPVLEVVIPMPEVPAPVPEVPEVPSQYIRIADHVVPVPEVVASCGAGSVDDIAYMRKKHGSYMKKGVYQERSRKAIQEEADAAIVGESHRRTHPRSR